MSIAGIAVDADSNGRTSMSDTAAKIVYAVDWKMMKEIYWNDTPSDGDRKRRRQAEFLAHGLFPWNLVSEVGVINEAMAGKVNSLLTGVTHVPVVIAL